LPGLNWISTIYHGLPRDLLTFNLRPAGTYLAFLGRISPEKRPDRAIEIAARAGIPLKIAAKIDRVDQAYWDEVIGPMVRSNPTVEFIGEITEREKAAFLGNASALLFPIDWPEPFGLVLIEAMACGTPIIAFRNGSVPELVTEDAGFVVSSVDEGVDAASRIGEIDRRAVRACFESRFSAERMTRDYVSVYERLIATSAGRDNACRDEFDLAGAALLGRPDPAASEMVPGFPERR
jgi:glycosyltransferase involved in cell wall biosynthesis